jgi:hypothetical protein
LNRKQDSGSSQPDAGKPSTAGFSFMKGYRDVSPRFCGSIAAASADWLVSGFVIAKWHVPGCRTIRVVDSRTAFAHLESGLLIDLRSPTSSWQAQ